MKLSPLDVKHQDFKPALNGYNKAQVRDFLTNVSDMLEQKLEEVKELSIQLVERDEKIKELQVSELELKKAAVLAERVANEARAQAKRESELILRETKAKSAEIIKEAEKEKETLLQTAKSNQENLNKETTHIKEKALQGSRID